MINGTKYIQLYVLPSASFVYRQINCECHFMWVCHVSHIHTQYKIDVHPSMVMHWKTVNMAKKMLSKLVMPKLGPSQPSRHVGAGAQALKMRALTAPRHPLCRTDGVYAASVALRGPGQVDARSQLSHPVTVRKGAIPTVLARVDFPDFQYLALDAPWVQGTLQAR